MTTTASAPTRSVATDRMPLTARGAQAFLLLPLGGVQLVATIVFSITLGLHGAGDWTVATWAPLMAIACITVASRFPRRSTRVFHAALALLCAQVAFSAVKLFAYHESASFVFLGMISACLALLVATPSRRWFNR